uniref:O-methyltransferase domain-containing protein n=1 Tax=Phaeocystis antarctica TaxID=33657 RepID=A0A7S0I119_9EUKA
MLKSLMAVVAAQLVHATSRHSNLLESWNVDRRLLSAMSFVNETRAHAGVVQQGGLCSKGAYQHVEKLARLLSEDLIHTSRHYTQHSFGGIFANGGSNKFDYHQVKSRFIFDRVCAKQTQINQVCEVGFMAGHTAMLFAEAAPHAKVISFDLGSASLVPWLQTQNQRLRQAYGERWMGVVKGSSLQTVPAWHREHPNFKCDVVFVDGGKTTQIRAADFANFARMSHSHTLVFFDEVTTQSCVNGSSPESKCYTYNNGAHKIRDGTTAKTAAGANRASREGIIKVRQCQWPPGWEGQDGICAARFRIFASGTRSIGTVARKQLRSTVD